MLQDIREIKRALREKYRGLRADMNINEKSAADKAIFERITSFKPFYSADAVLCFVSTEVEVDTHPIIEWAAAMGKTVAVPKCLDKNGNMDFFIIRSLDELISGAFGLSEPDINKAARFTGSKNAVCVLPGFAYDREGYRIGYGKGYYDRFLNRFDGCKIGVCYNNCIAPSLPHGRFDKPADFIVTGKYVITVTKNF